MPSDEREDAVDESESTLARDAQPHVPILVRGQRLVVAARAFDTGAPGQQGNVAGEVVEHHAAQRIAGKPHRRALTVVHQPSVGVHGLSAGVGDVDIGRGVEDGGEHLEQFRPPEVVRVEAGDVLAARLAQAGVHGSADTAWLLSQTAQARVADRRHCLRSRVGGPVVDDHQLKVRPRLRQHAGDGLSDIPRPVARRHDDRYRRLGRAHRHPVPRGRAMIQFRVATG